MARLETELHDYLDEEFNSQKATIQRNNNKLVSLLRRSIREGGINRHLNYTQLVQAYGPEFAQETYDHALRQISQEIPTRLPIRKPAKTETEAI